MKKIYIVLLVVFSLISCQKDDIQMWNSGNYIQFTEHYKDSLIYSFFFYGDQNEIKIPLNFRLIGMPLEKDELVNIVVNGDLTTAPSDSYTLPSDFVFKKGLLEDEGYLFLKKVPLLDTKEVRLVLDIQSSPRLKPGHDVYTRKVIRFSSMVSIPTWWPEVEENLLGEYSEKKFKLFMEVTGIGDLTDLSESERWSLARKFKYYLIEKEEQGKPVLEDDGSKMSVPVIG